MTDQSELFPPPPRKRGRPLRGLIIEDETPEQRRKRLARERRKRFQGTENYARSQLKYWKATVAMFAIERNGGVLTVNHRKLPRTDKEREAHKHKERDRYWRRKKEREELEAQLLAKPQVQENLALDDLPPGFVALPPAEQKRLAFAEARERLETLVASNRLAGHANEPALFSWFTFEPLHYAPFPEREACGKCGLRIKTPLGARRETTNLADWEACVEINCRAMPDVPDEVFWPRKEEL